MAQDLSDPVIDEIHAIRLRISERFGHDPARLVAHLIELQEQHRDRLFDPAKLNPRTNESGIPTRAATGL